MATERFVIQDGAKRLEYTCVLDAIVLKSICRKHGEQER